MKYSEIKARASELRKNQTPSEKLLWQNLRKHKLIGKKFLRQHPIVYESRGNEHFFFVPDFYCAQVKLAVELDGKIHEKTIERDTHRDSILNSMGIRIVRINNEELMDMDSVLKRIELALKQ
ncbi:MAG: endonuclease domain-containing protein [Bacteroidales bacterium]|nr:MAG: endonuclease domain-containing protein [Bacteroidales bacterium]